MNATQPTQTGETATLIIRACADCEKEHGVLNRADSRKSHGTCKRHFVATHREWDFAEAEILQAVRAVEAEGPEAWCPDLGQPWNQ